MVIFRVLLSSLGIVLIVAGPSATLMRSDPWTSAMPTLLAGGFLMLMANIDRLSSFKAGPLEAQLREAVREAYATIEELKSTAKLNAKAVFFQLASSQFIGGTKFSQKMAIRDEVVGLLERIGFNQLEIIEAEKDWRDAIRLIYYRLITHAIEGRSNPHHVNPKATESQKLAIRRLNDEYDFFERKVPSAVRMREIVSETGSNSSAAESLIDDFHFFETQGTLRDRVVFLRLADE